MDGPNLACPVRFGAFIRRVLRRPFVRDGRGQVAIIFALSLLPMLILIGLGVDYGRALKLQTELDGAADAAALSAVSNSTSRFTLPTQASIQKYFDGAAGSLPTGATYTVSSSAKTSVTSLFVTVNYTATLPTTFGGLVGVPTITIKGTSSSAGQLPTYVNFYLLLDNSPSMGIGATSADIQNLEALTPGNCAFSCHQHSFTSSGKITGDDLSDNYHIAKNNGVTTRIDVLRSATQSLTTTATNAETVPNEFKMAVYTFSDNFQTIAPLTRNLSSVQSAAGAIDLAYAYYDQRDTQTSFDTALTYANRIIPSSGLGVSSAQPTEFLFLVTDGVEDEPVNSASGSGDRPDKWANGKSGAPSNTKPNITSNQSGNVSSTRLITTMTQSMCDSLKNRGVKIAILNTTYLPVVNNSFYNQWVAPISNAVPTQLQSCASPGFFFQISPTQGISQAMQAMFQAALTDARLTH
ncbi:MAG TPA: VWA domain-containing protein [Beijerinckiaceae bacterium]|nr:VWA domain-containing protein [Beijerinckiaceae bacterium]